MVSTEIVIKNFEIVNELLLVSFSDNSEAIVNLKTLRERCPCASCAGETDALGNLYTVSYTHLPLPTSDLV